VLRLINSLCSAKLPGKFARFESVHVMGESGYSALGSPHQCSGTADISYAWHSGAENAIFRRCVIRDLLIWKNTEAAKTHETVLIRSLVYVRRSSGPISVGCWSRLLSGLG